VIIGSVVYIMLASFIMFNHLLLIFRNGSLV